VDQKPGLLDVLCNRISFFLRYCNETLSSIVEFFSGVIDCNFMFIPCDALFFFFFFLIQILDVYNENNFMCTN
jgi:hypothetical protein